MGVTDPICKVPKWLGKEGNFRPSLYYFCGEIAFFLFFELQPENTRSEFFFTILGRISDSRFTPFGNNRYRSSSFFFEEFLIHDMSRFT
jgi:hypothetical protein